MDRMSKVGWVVLVAGLVLMASAAIGWEREVIGRATVWTNVEIQNTTPLEIPQGTISIWVEDHPSWPPGPWDLDATLVRGEDETFSGDWPDEMRYRDIEGVRCFLVAMMNDVFPEGEYRIMVELYVLVLGGESVEVGIYVLSSQDPWVGVGLVTGAVMAAIGAVIVTMRAWPSKD